MLRGAIDFADRTRVAGWIHSDAADVRGRTVLAFLDSDCVGAGGIDVFRQDLADAGLGDGMVGFDFAAGVAEEDVGRVTVRLEGSDFALIQRGAQVTADGGLAAALRDVKAIDAAEIDWMRARGWIDARDEEYLRAVASVGLYDGPLDGASAGAEARRLLELYVQGPVDLATERLSLAELAERRLELLAAQRIAVAAIHGEGGALMLLEGSNRDEDFIGAKPLVGAVQHGCGADRLLLLDLRAQFGGRGEEVVTVYLPR